MHTYIHTYIYTYIHIYTYMPLQWVCIIVRGGFIRGFLSRVFCLDGFVRGGFVLSTSVRIYMLSVRLVGAFLSLAWSLRICGMSFTGSPTRSALSTASLRWFGVAWKVWHHPIS